MSDDTRSIQITNVGPIESLAIPVPEGGGVVVLQGANGAGKSHALRAASALAAGKGKGLRTRDGALAGSVSGLGAMLSVGRRTRGKGTLSVDYLAGEDPSALVDPGLKDPDAADIHRIAALCRLGRVKPDPEKLAALCPDDDFREVASPGTLDKPTVPDMAAGFKSDAERVARKHERLAADCEGQAKAFTALLVGGDEIADGAAPPDLDALHRVVEGALEKRGAAVANEKAWTDAQASAKNAREYLDKAEADPDLTSTHDAALAVHDAAEALTGFAEGQTESEDALTAAQEALGSAQARRYDAEHALTAAEKVLSSAKANEKVLEAARATIETSQGLDFTAGAVNGAELALTTARKAHEDGVRTKQNMAQRAKGADALRESEAHIERAKHWRSVARNCESVVSEAIGGDHGLRVLEGRLVLTTDRGDTYFADLSNGERYRIAIDIAVDAIGDEGPALLVIEQEAWEGLDPQNRLGIDDHARKRGVVILTAECDGGELRVEPGVSD